MVGGINIHGRGGYHAGLQLRSSGGLLRAPTVLQLDGGGWYPLFLCL